MALALGGARCASTHLAYFRLAPVLTLGDRDPSRSPYGFSRRRLRCSARWRGPKIKSKQSKQSKQSRAEHIGALFALARTTRANGAPAVRRGGVGKAAGWRARCAPVCCTYMDVRSTNPGAPSRSRKAGDGMDAGGSATQEQLTDAWRPHRRGVLSLGYLSLHKQRKVTRSPARGAEALLRRSIKKN